MPDKHIYCIDCDGEFIFNEAEQAFFKNLGFANHPKRCKSCRQQRRNSGEKQELDKNIEATRAKSGREFAGVWNESKPRTNRG